MVGRFALALVASASMLPLATPAAAQDANTEEEIVVTAQKREELLRDVPQSVTAITEETLERLQADSFEDYVGRVPGMVATGEQAGNSRLVLRGLNNEGIGAAVATYVDETPFGSSTGLVNAAALALDLDPFDVERVEVLRGPQGTLYGANSMAGLIKFVTRDPSFDAYELRVRATGESTDGGDESWGARVAANIPLGNQAGLRISGFQRSTGGFIDTVQDINGNGVIDPGEPRSDDTNSLDTSGARATFLLQATDDLSIRLSATVQDVESADFGSIPYNVTPGPPAPNRQVAGPTHGDLLALADFPNPSDTTYRILNGTVNWDLGWASLVSSSSYGELDQFRLLGDNLIRQNNEVMQEKFTQEFRLVSPTSDGLEWMLGFFYTEEDGLIHQEQNFAGLLDAVGFTPVLAGIFGITEDDVRAQALILADLDSEYSETAWFGEATYHFTPQFDVTLGARYSENEQEFDQRITNTPISAFLFGLGDGGSDSSEDVTTYSFSPRLRLNEHTMIYGRVASGFRPGGPNIIGLGTSIPPSYEADTLVNYEVGIKSDLFNNLLRFDAAIFHIDWDNIQLLFAEEIAPNNFVSGNANGGTAVSQGVEWSTTLTPIEGLSIAWTGAYTDAHLDGEPPELAALRMENGDQLPFSPEWSSSIDIDFEWTAFGTTTAYVGGGARYVSDQMSNFAIAPPPADQTPDDLRQIELPSYTVVDLRSGLRFDTFTVEVFARNVGDERGPTRMGPTETSDDATVLRPRTVGVTLTAEF